MIKHTFILLVLSTFLPSFGVSQISMGIITTEQRFIRSAVDSAIYIIRQDYTLKNIHDSEAPEYGLGGKDYFGRAYFLAVYAEDMLVLMSPALAPWDQDPNFEQFRENDSIKPVLSAVAIRPVVSDVFSPIEDGFAFRAQKGILSADLDLGHPSLEIEQNSTDPAGWGIFVYTTEPLADNEAAELQFKIYKIKPEFTTENAVGEINRPTISGSLIGAAYITESFGIGSVNLSMAGVVNEENQSWGVRSIPEPPESIDLVPVESAGEGKSVLVQFINYRDSSPLPLLTIEDRDRQMTYETDRDGVISLLFSAEDLSEGVELYLNDQPAVCFEQSGEYQVECKYESSLFLPKRPASNCN